MENGKSDGTEGYLCESRIKSGTNEQRIVIEIISEDGPVMVKLFYESNDEKPIGKEGWGESLDVTTVVA